MPFAFLEILDKDYLIVNKISLYHLSTTLQCERPETSSLWNFNEKNIRNIYNIEKNLADQDPHKKKNFFKDLPKFLIFWVCY